MRRSWLRLFLAGVVILGAIAAYLVTSERGERLLHGEIETQLSRLLAGPVEIAEVQLRFDDGLRVEARGFEAYPSPDPTRPPILKARRVLAWVDFLALLVGRLELSTLILEGPQVRIERAADGSLPGLPWTPEPPPIVVDRDLTPAEQLIRQLESLDPEATAFLEEFRAADRIQILDGTASYVDHRSVSEDGAPRELRVELVSGIARRDWLTDEVALDLQGVYVDGRHAPFPITIGITRDRQPHFNWTLSFSQVPLEAAQTPLAFIEEISGLAGTLDAQLHLTTNTAGIQTLAFEGIVENATVGMRRSRSIISQERLEIRTLFALESRRMSLSSGRLSGEQIGIDFKGHIARPIRLNSRARIETRMVGVKIDGLRELARQFENEFEFALAISRLTERVEAGQIRYLQAAATARVSHWLDLASGQSLALPDDFVLGGAIEEILIGSTTASPIKHLAGELQWADDQISLRKMTGTYRGQPLPELSGVLDGVSHLARTSDAARTMTADPPPIPGVSPLFEIFKPRNPDALPPVKAIGLAIDHLEHPIFGWPLENLRVLIEPLRRGMQMNIREGLWGGAGVTGDIVWLSDSETPKIEAQLAFEPAPSGPIPTDPPDEPDPKNEDRWSAGRFELEFRPRPYLPFQTATGFFRLDGSDLIGNEVEVAFAPRGKGATRMSIDLADAESVGLDLSFAITEGRFEDLSEFVVLPPDLTTGAVGATGTLAGRVRPDTSFIAELDGSVRVEAKDGRILTTLPLLLRLGKATEGYNPFAKSGELQYESMTGTLALEHGRLTIEDFEIEGPLRVFANARLDTNRQPARIRAVVGIFLFRTPNQIFGNIPLVSSFLPGSDRGLIGAYFKVKGPLDEPDVDPLPLQTLMSSVPSAIKAPFKVMRYLFNSGQDES